MNSAHAIITIFLALLGFGCGDMDNRSEPTHRGESTRVLHADFTVAGTTQSALIEYPVHMTDVSAKAFTKEMLLDIESIRQQPQVNVRIATAAAFATELNSGKYQVLVEYCQDNELDGADQVCGRVSADDLTNACDIIDCPEGSMCSEGLCI